MRPDLAMPGAAPWRAGPLAQPAHLPLWRVRPDHLVAGPAGGSPCNVCLRARLAANGHMSVHPVPQDQAPDLASAAMQQWLAAGAPLGMLLEWRGGAWTSHVALPLPGCACAGHAAPLGPMAAVSDLVGIVTRVSTWTLPGLTAGQECVMALASAAGRHAAGGQLTLLDGAACGSLQGARTAAVCEVLERYCAGFVPAGLPVCNVRELGQDHVTPACDSFGGLPLGADDPVRWVRGRRLADDEPCWVQASAVYFPYPCDRREPPRSHGGSEGLAAGSSWEAAVEHATHERIERDAFIRAWRYGGRRAALPNPYAGRPDLAFTLVGNRFGLPVVTAFAESDAIPYATAGIAARSTVAEAVEASAREAIGAQALYQRFKLDHGPSLEARYRHAVDAALRPVRRSWREEGSAPVHAGAARTWDALRGSLPDAVAVDVGTSDVRRLGVHVARVVIPGCHGFEPVDGQTRLGGNAAPPPY